MTISTDLLKNLATDQGILLDDTALNRFDIYAELLLYWNERINLTAITDPTELVYKHFLDSLLFLKYVPVEEKSKIIDVGTGAGFPGLALLIARPDLDMTLLDSTKKKLNVISDIISNLGLDAHIVHSRAEDAGKSKEYREKYDIVTARAVSNLRDLSEYCLPFTKVGGTFAPLKGLDAKKEISEAEKAISILGGEIDAISTYNLADYGERSIVCIKKISQSPIKYPRPSAQIAKSPLK